jgi:quinol monooxygenase YgiN
MAVRLVVTIKALPGKGAELAKVYQARAEIARKEAGCEQFDVFQGIGNTDTVVLLEKWVDQAALDVHAQQPATKAAIQEGLRAGVEREDYTYNRTR